MIKQNKPIGSTRPGEGLADKVIQAIEGEKRKPAQSPPSGGWGRYVPK